MAPSIPYTYIQCPCSDSSTLLRGADTTTSPTEAGQDEDDRTFDPRAPRSNYSLYPLEYLLYCEDCHQIRCPRCVAEEIATYYCPNCLFEVPFSNLRSEGNRCTRSCFQCPVCIGPLSVSSIDAPPNPNLLAAENASGPSGPYILTCSYCNWSSEEIGIKFDRPNGISSQLARLRNGGQPRPTRRDRRKEPLSSAGNNGSAPAAGASSDGDEALGAGTAVIDEELDTETQFANLLSFYKAQLADASVSTPGALAPLGDLGYSSPGSLSRIMSLYTGSGAHERGKAKSRAATVREALDSDEGLQLPRLDDSGAIAQLHAGGWDSTVAAAQAATQEHHPVQAGEPAARGGAGAVRFADQLRPVPYLLRAKRSKRCPVCRHIISKPESKVAATRFRIRLVAGGYIPSISIRPLVATAPASSGANATATPATQSEELLAPLKPVQYLLTFKNPIFEPVRVTLATPATTPGRFASKVTVLCPQFEIDANTDVWDEALKDGSDKDKERRRRRRGEDSVAGAGHGGQHRHQVEAGKIWERGRNWVSIVVEVVPASLRLDVLALAKKGDTGADLGPLREDEDVLEIPMFVRVEWEADVGTDEVGTAPGKDREAREKRELAYWCVLGIGRISRE